MGQRFIEYKKLTHNRNKRRRKRSMSLSVPQDKGCILYKDRELTLEIGVVEETNLAQ